MYHWISIEEPEDYDELTSLIDPFDYGTGEVARWARTNLTSDVGGVLVEYPYVDKDYRSTFYNYYSKKGAPYSPHSARLHLFKKGWTMLGEPIRLAFNGEELSPEKEIGDGYLGFIVVRPTKIQTIGRSLLSPYALKNVKGRLIEHKHKCHVMGYRAHVKGFPYMQQHSDIAVCAHTACWAVLRHYSERYSLYPEVLVHDISHKGGEFVSGGLLPSLGLTARDAERIFAAFGTFPLLVHGSDQEGADKTGIRFFDEMLAYLESGFPLFGIQARRGHAVAIVGYRASQHAQGAEAEYRGRAWDYVSHLLVVDDNHPPYFSVSRVAAGSDYLVDAFDGFIVPLPEKLFLPAGRALDFAEEVLNVPPDNFEYLEGRKDLVTRCFVTTTASWHRFIRTHAGSLPSEFATLALELPMPQFIWVVEFATPQQRNANQVEARLILDATAGTNDAFPAFLLHGSKGALWLDRANREPMQYQPFVHQVPALSEMVSNLATY